MLNKKFNILCKNINKISINEKTVDEDTIILRRHNRQKYVILYEYVLTNKMRARALPCNGCKH
jgi:hypothetical protein